METAEALTYQTVIYVAGAGYQCSESYDSLCSRLLWGGASKKSSASRETIGVTIKGVEDGTPTRALIQRQMVSAVVEVPEGWREEVTPPAPEGGIHHEAGSYDSADLSDPTSRPARRARERALEAMASAQGGVSPVSP